LSASGRLALLPAALIQLPTGTIDISPGPSGLFYAVRIAPPVVVVIDSTGAVSSEIDVPGVRIPGGIAVAADGTMAISDAARESITVIGPEGTVRGTLAAPGSPGSVAWSGTSIWYAGLDLGVVAEAGTGTVILNIGRSLSSLDVSGTRGVVCAGDVCFLFTATDGITASFDARSACFAGEAVLLLTGGEARYDTSSFPLADSLESFSRALWLPHRGPAVFSRERGLLRL
jgi:hypothetical protein